MAKKSKLPTPDENGILNYGIYQRYVGPHKKISFDELDEKLREHCEEFEKPATERIKEIREWLFSVLKPHITGPISREKARSDPGYHRPLNDGSGSKIYTLVPGITDKDNASVEAQEVQGALDALYNLDVIAHNLEAGNVDSIIRSSIALGMLIERISIRRFEPDTRRGKKVLESARTGGKLNASLTPDQKKSAVASVAALISKGESQNNACRAVAKELQRSASTVAKVYRESNAE